MKLGNKSSKAAFAWLLLNFFSLSSAQSSPASGPEFHTGWRGVMDGYLSVSKENRAVVLIVMCDALNGIYPSALLGVVEQRDNANWKWQIFGKQDVADNNEPGLGFAFTTTQKFGPTITARTERGGGGEFILEGTKLSYKAAGGTIRPSDVRRLAAASEITVCTGPHRFTFPGTPTAQQLRSLSCSKDRVSQ